MAVSEHNRRVIVRCDSTQENTRESIRVGFYIRVSTDTEDQLNSFEAQREACRVVLREHPEYMLVKIYADAGVTGTLAEKRPGFMEMIADAEAGRLDLIITKSLSRWSRNTLECLQYMRELKEWGVALIFEKECIDTRNMLSELAVTIYAGFSQEESRSISENTKIGIRWNFGMGEARWCPMYGYTKNEEGTYQIVPNEAAVVKNIYDLYEHGFSIQKITKELNQKQIPSARGGIWRPCRVHEILRNIKYTGDLLMQKYYTEDHIHHKAIRNDGTTVPIYMVPNHHEAIISKEQFHRVKRILAMRNIANGRPGQYPFGDFLHCPYCGTVLTQRMLVSDQSKRTGWFCEHGCGALIIRSTDLEKALLVAYRKLAVDIIKQEIMQLSQEKRAAAMRTIQMKEDHPTLHRVDYYWVEQLTDKIEIGKQNNPADRTVTVFWKCGIRTDIPIAMNE